MRNQTKTVSIVIIGIIYLIAILLGYFVFITLNKGLHELWALFLADVVATVVVWGFGLFYKNVSVYDPYWSVAPPVMFTVWAFYKSTFTLPVVLLLIAVWYWGIRLTGNWAYTFKGLAHEDWRYTRYRETQSPFIFHVINFFGLNMMPTVLVFAAMLPGFGLFESAEAANILTWLGFAICISAATLQLVADTQIHRFREAHPGRYCDVGFWKHGRHPNYLGEISMWWGVWTMYASIYGFDWLIIAPIAMTALFLFISIPMMERRQLQNKPGYAEYRKNTRMLI
jgi:steroid 5-alpha reductase family enzyme